MFRQCLLTRHTTSQICWIPENLASAGKWLRIKAEDGWRITKVYARGTGPFVTDGRNCRSEFGSLA